MKTLLYGLLAETSIHPGAGQSSGFVDLPVARESATDYPVIVGSSIKGALRGTMPPSELEFLFGSVEVRDRDRGIGGAGNLILSDARLLLLPIRSLASYYMWVTCPYLIERYMRDRLRFGLSTETFNFSLIDGDDEESPKYLGPEVGELFLEERQFFRSGDLPEKLIELLTPLIRHNETGKRLEKQLVVVSDKSFAWFARYGLPVNARNVLDKDKKTSNNLWYEETLPPDSLFYLLLAERNTGALDKIQDWFHVKPYFQVGGNETIGQGWFVVSEPLKGGQQ